MIAERLEPWRVPRKRVVLVREFGKIDQYCYDLLRFLRFGAAVEGGEGSRRGPC